MFDLFENAAQTPSGNAPDSTKTFVVSIGGSAVIGGAPASTVRAADVAKALSKMRADWAPFIATSESPAALLPAPNCESHAARSRLPVL